MADQRLNIIFTGDVSQLSKAMQSIESDLTKFEQKLKESLGAEGFAQINQAVDQLKQKLASLQAIDIKANPEKLFAAVREVSAELGKLKDSEVLLKLNDSKALSQINNIDKLLSDLTASITIDANVKTEIDRIKSQLSGLTVKVGADASVAESAIKNIQSKLSLLQDEKFILSADGNQAESVINEIFTDLQKLKDTKVLINADGSPAENVIDKLRVDLQKSLIGNVSIDTAGIQSKLQQLGEINLGVDTSEIDVAIRSIREKLAIARTIDIQANPQQALTAINEILTEIAKIKSSELLLKSDNTDVLSDINQIQTRLQEVKSNINISANLDTKNLEALLKPLSTQVSVSVNTKQAEVEIKALLEQVRNLKGQDILINLDGTQVVRTVDAIEKELLQLQVSLKKATNPAEIAKLTQSLQTFKNSLSATNANQFSSTMNRAQNATFAFSQVLREAPAFAFSFQTGLLALSNNLPILADRFKEARASGLSFGKILGDMGKSLFSLPGIMTIASTAAIFLAGAFNKSGKSAAESAREIRSATDLIDDATDSVQGDIVKVNSLVNAFANTTSFEKQKRVIEELKDVNQSYFGDLKAGKSTLDDITKATNEYTKALVQEAIVKGLTDEISELAKQQRIAEKEVQRLDKATIQANKNLVAARTASAGQVKGIASVTGSVIEAETEYVRFNKLLKQAEINAGNLNIKFAELRDEINKQVGLSLDFKDLDKDKDKFKDLTDEIIARARAFVKQFGETFIVPDLDESFTNTKDKIKKSAIKLFDDLAKGQLKIRIPVQVITEADLIPEGGTGTPIPKEKIDELQRAYFEQLKSEFEEPFKVDLTIAPQVELEKAKERLRKAVEDGQFEEALNALQFKKIDPQTGNEIFEGLNNEAKKMATTINDTLTPAFQNLFDAIINNEDPLKAFFQSIVQSINQVIQKLIQAAIQAAILTLLSGGSATPLKFGATFIKMLTGGNIASPGGFIGQGSIFNPGESQLVANVRGTDLQFVLTQGDGRIGRTQ